MLKQLRTIKMNLKELKEGYTAAGEKAATNRIKAINRAVSMASAKNCNHMVYKIDGVKNYPFFIFEKSNVILTPVYEITPDGIIIPLSRLIY